MTTFKKLPQMSPRPAATARKNKGGTSRRNTDSPGRETNANEPTNKRPRVLLPVSPDHPEPRKIRRAVDALEDGAVIAYPTDTVYGLGCDAMNKKAVDRLYQIKGMARTQQLAFIVPDLSEIARWAIVENRHYRLLRHLFPGPYTCILEATREVPKLLMSKRKTIGLRVPALELTRALARELGRPIVTTSANREGHEPFIDPRDIEDAFPGLGLVIDGDAGGTQPTTVLDLTTWPFEVVREGAGPIDEFLH
jgi:tRNA threonylcarbamoyl adenosine modification protein (Sua5/YciO/YrdC/YwlC family)